MPFYLEIVRLVFGSKPVGSGGVNHDEVKLIFTTKFSDSFEFNEMVRRKVGIQSVPWEMKIKESENLKLRFKIETNIKKTKGFVNFDVKYTDIPQLLFKQGKLIKFNVCKKYALEVKFFDDEDIAKINKEEEEKEYYQMLKEFTKVKNGKHGRYSSEGNYQEVSGKVVKFLNSVGYCIEILKFTDYFMKDDKYVSIIYYKRNQNLLSRELKKKIDEYGN